MLVEEPISAKMIRLLKVHKKFTKVQKKVIGYSPKTCTCNKLIPTHEWLYQHDHQLEGLHGMLS